MTTLEDRCARLLKDLRKKRGYTLTEFEEKSNGEIKAVVLGSYERGTRAISLARLEQLAELYDVPVEYFLIDQKATPEGLNSRLVFDLRTLRTLENLDESLQPVKYFLASIAKKRSDWNGEILSIRASDGEVLTMMTQIEAGKLTMLLKAYKLIVAVNN